MASPRGTRKEPLFVILLLTSIIVLVIFCLCASKVGREIKAQVHVFWAVNYTIALSVISCCYQTVYVAYYTAWSLPSHSETRGSMGCGCEGFMVTLVFNFVLGIAWIFGVVAQLFDPNNAGSHDAEMGLESESAFKARIAASGVVAAGLLTLAILASLRSQCGIFGSGGAEILSHRTRDMEGHRYEDQERVTSAARPVEIQEAEVGRNGNSPERGSSVRVVLEKIGIGRISGR